MSDSLPLVTVIIPSFNHAAYIANAIDSVLSQTYQNIELIVIDDGSTDNSHEVIERYSGNPRLISILNIANAGQGVVLNKAIDVSRGAYLCILPSDDWFVSNKIELQVQRFLVSPADVGIVYAKGQRYYMDDGTISDVDLPVFEGYIAAELLRYGNFIYPATPMFRRECFQSYRFDESFVAEGEAIFVKVALSYKAVYLKDVVAVMRDHTRNSGKNIRLMHSENIRWLEKFFRSDFVPEDIRALKGYVIGKRFRLDGLLYVRISKDYASGRHCLFRAIRSYPMFILDWKVVAGIVISILAPVLRR
jgi:glycosyltransferase involved in cell wall biosynthesis